MSVEINGADPSDIPEIQRVASAAWREAHAPIIGDETVDEFLNEYYDRESFRDRIEHDSTIIDVATDSTGTVVGYVCASKRDDTGSTFHLNQIYVLPTQWGEGIGGQLLEHVEDEVREFGGEKIRLGVMAENDRAVEFYERAGYDRIDEDYDDRIETRNYLYEKVINPDTFVDIGDNC